MDSQAGRVLQQRGSEHTRTTTPGLSQSCGLREEGKGDQGRRRDTEAKAGSLCPVTPHLVALQQSFPRLISPSRHIASEKPHRGDLTSAGCSAAPAIRDARCEIWPQFPLKSGPVQLGQRELHSTCHGNGGLWTGPGEEGWPETRRSAPP